MTLSKPHYLSKTPPPNIIPLMFRASPYEFWEDKYSVHSKCSLYILDSSALSDM